MLRDNLEFNKSVKPNSDFLEELKQKLPEFFTAEKYDEDGKLVEESFFDIEKFKATLEDQNYNELSSGYQLDFIGKNYAKKQSGERPTTVIVPDNVHNSKPENTSSKNVFLTGDNLEVLRHLQQNYTNSIDVIYIDPPYNTGNGDFIYPDKFEYSDDELESMFGLNKEELKRLKSIQGKSTHSAWLTFMYPRLHMSKKILKPTGVIFVSIDDSEQANLKLLMDEIYGEINFVSKFEWRKKTGANDAKDIAVMTEQIYLYTKSAHESSHNKIWSSDEESVDNNRFKLTDEYVEERGKYYLDTLDRGGLQYSDSMNFGIKAPDGGIIFPNGRDVYENDGWIWKWSKKKIEWGLENKFVEFVESSKSIGSKYTIKYKVYEKVDNEGKLKESTGRAFSNLILEPINTQGNSEFKKLFENKSLFSNPKPTDLIKYLLKTQRTTDITVMDFFAGSGTTAHAVMQLNSEDGGNRRFIMCTLPEPTFSVNSDGSEQATKGGRVAYDAGYRSIDEISRERICRVAAKIQEENPLLSESQDFGFKHYRVVAPSQETMESIEYSNSMQLDLFDDMISKFSSESLGVDGQASGQDTILQTYLVKDGYKFDAKVEWLDIDGVKVPYIEGQRLYIISSSWETQNTRALINAIGTNQIRVQTIVVYGHSIEMARYRELEIALAQLETRPNLQVRY